MFLDQAYLHVQPGDSSQTRLEKKMWDYALHESPDAFLRKLEAMRRAVSCYQIALPVTTQYLSISTDTNETLQSWNGTCLMQKMHDNRMETIV